jgi:hypothetical protein
MTAAQDSAVVLALIIVDGRTRHFLERAIHWEGRLHGALYFFSPQRNVGISRHRNLAEPCCGILLVERLPQFHDNGY